MQRRLWVLTGLLLAVAACAPRQPGEPQPGTNPAYVEVTNNYALPVEVYVVGSSIRHRMGTVHPGMTSHFVVPPTLVGGNTVEFQASPGQSGGLARSGGLLLAPGSVVDFVIGAQLFNSTATIRP